MRDPRLIPEVRDKDNIMVEVTRVESRPSVAGTTCIVDYACYFLTQSSVGRRRAHGVMEIPFSVRDSQEAEEYIAMQYGAQRAASVMALRSLSERTQAAGYGVTVNTN